MLFFRQHIANDIGSQTLLEYFGNLDITCEISQVDAGSRAIAAALVDFAVSSQASYLVAGAFRYGCLAEILLGRVTYHLLAHAGISC